MLKYNQYILYKRKYIVAVVDVKEWPHRSMVHKGWIGPNAILIAAREMTAAEVEEHKNDNRCYACKYTSWDELIKDELKYNPSGSFIDKLKESSQLLELDGQEDLFDDLSQSHNNYTNNFFNDL